MNVGASLHLHFFLRARLAFRAWSGRSFSQSSVYEPVIFLFVGSSLSAHSGWICFIVLWYIRWGLSLRQCCCSRVLTPRMSRKCSLAITSKHLLRFVIFLSPVIYAWYIRMHHLSLDTSVLLGTPKPKTHVNYMKLHPRSELFPYPHQWGYRLHYFLSI